MLHLLKRGRHSVVMCADGTEAVAAFKQHKDEFDLILLDQCMPIMCGSEAAKLMRQYEQEQRGRQTAVQSADTAPGEAGAATLAPTPLFRSATAPAALDAVPPAERSTASSAPTVHVQPHSGFDRVPIVAVTAATMMEERVELRAHGIDDILLKPLQSAQLDRVLASAATRAERVRGSTRPLQ